MATNFRTQEGYTATELSYLPLTTRLSVGRDLTVDYMKVSQFTMGYNLIGDAAKRGDNIGLDEFPDVESFELFLRFAHCFAIQDIRSVDLLGLIIILPNFSCRTTDTVMANLRIVLSPTLTSALVFKHVLANVVSLSEKLVVDLDLGYVACVVQVAIPCIQWILVIREAGYVNVATLPKTVRYMDKGLVENCLMYKRLAIEMRPKRPWAMIQETMDNLFPSSDEFKKVSLPMFDCLPLLFTFSNGIQANLRNRQHSDDVLLFDIIHDAAKRGEGFGSDEIPCISLFRSSFMCNYVCILEDAASGSFMGAMFVEPSLHRRTESHVVCDTCNILHPKYRGIGLGKEIIDLNLALSKELGYSYLLNDSFVTNVQVQKMVSSNEIILVVGCLPFGAHVKDFGWVDMRFEFIKLAEAKSLCQLEGLKGILPKNNISKL